MSQSLQAAVAAATASVLRNHVASPADLADIAKKLPGRDSQQIVTECVHALCQWRDGVARDEDEGWYCCRHICMSIVQSAYSHCCDPCYVVILRYACCSAQVKRGSSLFGYVYDAAIACLVLGSPT